MCVFDGEWKGEFETNKRTKRNKKRKERLKKLSLFVHVFFQAMMEVENIQTTVSGTFSH